MTAIIIDDEPLARGLVREYLEPFTNIEIVGECGDGFEGIKQIHQLKPSLIFLDIQMPKITGFEMLELLEERPAVIFTTAFDEYALKAFEAHAIDYLLKPFSQQRFSKAIEKLLQFSPLKDQKEATQQLIQTETSLTAQRERVVVKIGGKIKIIMVAQIHYLEAADDYVKIHTQDGVFLKNKTLGFYEQSLPTENFVRTHRSFLVNLQEITRIEPYEKENYLAILKSGARVPVSKSGYPKLRVSLGL